MGADTDAFAVLGLAPDADRGAVEQAYRRLIKQFHPDRSGGDATRAVELNRAYRELRAALDGRGDVALRHIAEPRSAVRAGWRWPALLVALVAMATLLAAEVAKRQPVTFAGLGGEPSAAPPAGAMDRPLALAAIDSAALEAARLMTRTDEMGRYRVTGDCHAELRRSREIARFDRCAAFDHAVARLQDRDPLRDKGPFSQIAVTGRLWGAASSLSNDYVAIDSRLRRIRLRVELLLAPSEPAA